MSLLSLGQLEEAKSLFLKVLALDEAENRTLKAAVEESLAEVAIREKLFDEATEHVVRSLRTYLQIESESMICDCARLGARIAVETDLFSKAAALLGAEERFRRKSGKRLQTRHWEELQSIISRASTALGSRYAAEFAVGAQMRGEDLIRFIDRSPLF